MTPSQPDPLRAAVDAFHSTSDSLIYSDHCFRTLCDDCTRRGLRAAAPHLLAAVVAEVNELDLEASMKAEGSDVMLIPLRSALARLLSATPARAGTTDAEGGEG